MESRLQIALFGTSADPPTIGHRAILAWLATRFDQVAVWASDNPFKQGQTPIIHRSAMLALLVDSVRQRCPTVQLCPDLSSARSLDSVHLAQQRWPHGSLTFVVGSDVLDSLASWYCIHELLQAVHLLIVPRPGFTLTMQELSSLKNLGAQFTVAADFVGLNVSSTAYRRTKADETMIPAIAAYIHHHGLYDDEPHNPS